MKNSSCVTELRGGNDNRKKVKESWRLGVFCELGSNCLASCGWHTQGKDLAFVAFACDRYRSPMGFRNFLDDGQPKSGAAGILRTCPIGAVKPLEEMMKMFRLDSMPRVSHRHSHLFSDRLQPDGDCSPGRGVVQGVAE